MWSNKPDQYKAKAGKITSIGVGSEFAVVDNITFNIEFSKPISESIKGDPSLRKKKPTSKIYAGMEYAYMF